MAKEFFKNTLEYSGEEYRQLELLETIIDYLSEGVAFGNTRGELILFNAKAREIMGLGLTRESPENWAQHYGIYYEDTITPVPQDEIAMVRACRGENIFNQILYINNKGKKEGSFIQLNASPIRNAKGEIIGGAVIFRDITAERKLQTELEASSLYYQRAKAAAETANRAKSEFLANISHEIRTPLTAILGFTELLASSERLVNEEKKWVDTVHRSGKHLLSLVDDVLDLSKIESGHQQLRRETFHLSEVLDEVVASVKSLADLKGITIDIVTQNVPTTPLYFHALPLRQILLNLLGNAIKFTNQGSIKIQLSYQDHQFQCDIIDTGIGIAKDVQANLFAAFYQGDSTIVRRFGGTGLGLALSRKLAHSINGNLVLVESAPMKGSHFRLSFKPEFADNSGRTSSPKTIVAKKPSTKQLDGIHILLVEDCVDNQTLLRHFLEREGAQITVACDGIQAIHCATQQDYDVILMDIQMPGLDGYRATQELRKLSYERPIVALTAHVLDNERIRCLDAGCDDYLSKPVDPQALVRMVVKHHENWQKRRQVIPGYNEQPLILN